MIATTKTRIQDLYDATQTVIGQEKARKLLAVLLDRQIGVSNGDWNKADSAILAGNSGSGKTYLVKMMCKYSNLPFADTNATQYTESGYAGEDLSQMFLPLLEAAAVQIDEEHALYEGLPMLGKSEAGVSSVLHRDDIDEIVNRASTGVILLDEFDKWAHRINHHTGRLDTAIQSELLKMVEGSFVYISDDEDEVGVPFDTSKVLIICAGAFVGLSKLVLKRLDQGEHFADTGAFWNLIEQVDFVKYGLIPELAGRLSKIITLTPLRKEHLARIIRLPYGPIEELKERFEQVNCEWDVSDTAITYLADIALRREVGARGIDSVIWSVFSDALYAACVSERPTRVTLRVNQNKAEITER
jgi:ATP-dependent Clp protease ATP-binding subunit ClpX